MVMQQRVDPFIPIKGPGPTPQGQYGAQWLRKPRQAAPETPTASVPTQRVPLTQKPLPVGSLRSLDGIVLSSQPRIAQVRANTPRQRRTFTGDQPSTTKLPQPRRTPRQLETIAELGAHIKSSKSKWAMLPPKTQLIALILGAIGAGLSIQFLPLGEIIIGIYAVYAVAKNIPSRTSFLLALVALIGIVAILIVRGTDNLSENFAIYAFLLLAIGTVSLGLEIRRQEA